MLQARLCNPASHFLLALQSGKKEAAAADAVQGAGSAAEAKTEQPGVCCVEGGG